MSSSGGLTNCLKRVQVLGVLGSNNKNLPALATSLRALISKRRTLTRSKAEGLICNVFCPQIAIPSPGKLAIGLIRESYRISRSFCVRRSASRQPYNQCCQHSAHHESCQRAHTRGTKYDQYKQSLQPQEHWKEL